MFTDRPALVARGRRTGEAHADAPVIADRDQHKGEETAGKRLGLVAEFLMDAAAPLLAEEDAASVLPAVEVITSPPEWTALLEKRPAAKLRIVLPPLCLNAGALLI